jgi:hypothetical protein
MQGPEKKSKKFTKTSSKLVYLNTFLEGSSINYLIQSLDGKIYIGKTDDAFT